MHWEHRALTTGPPGKSHICLFFKQFFFVFWLCWVFVVAQTFPSCSKWELFFLLVHRALSEVASFVAEHRLRGARALLPQGTWEPSQTRDRTCVPCFSRQILNHWTTREAPMSVFYPNHPSVGDVCLIVGLSHTSLMSDEVEHLFMCLLFCVSSLKISLCLFFNLTSNYLARFETRSAGILSLHALGKGFPQGGWNTPISSFLVFGACCCGSVVSKVVSDSLSPGGL